VRFFAPVSSEPCDPAAERDPQAVHHCRTDELCLCDDASNCASGGGRLPGHCAPEASERRWCQHTCSSNSDCRSGYQCRSTGTNGAEPVPRRLDDGGVPVGDPTQFCAPAAVDGGVLGIGGATM
jgi:hypothetical protein